MIAIHAFGGGGLWGDFLADYPYGFDDIDPLRSSIASDLSAFRNLDYADFPEPGAVLCIGSSSMRLWHNRLSTDLAPLTLIPRGFGGSLMTDVIYFADEFVIPYRPRAILLYEGDNDIVSPANRSPERILADILYFADECRRQLPDVRIYVISIKPSIAREAALSAMQETNALIEEACAEKDYLFYVDVMNPMLNRNGTIRTDVFLGDNLHMNSLGYDLWAAAAITVVENEAPFENSDIPQWGGKLADTSGNVDTGDWLGWISVSRDHDWIYSWGMEQWIYFPDPGPSSLGAWSYIPRMSDTPR